MRPRPVERARWRVIYDHLAAHPDGAVVTYEELREALHLDPTQAACRHLIQAATRQAVRQLKMTGRVVAPVPNIGYRITPAVSPGPPVTPDLREAH
jgi:hypothetical protein